KTGRLKRQMVTTTLKNAEGMVIRKVISDRPIAVTYELTDFGKSALSILEDLRQWSEAHGIELNSK
uniref:winged helix-turn-helix transcriptional regulator n=1 Tax=Pseudoalteromonas 'SMAR' TaxID=3416908 RepID=UPI003AF286B3